MLDWQMFLSAENFRWAWNKVRANHGCAGVDGETIEAFKRNVDQNLATLRRQLQTGTYQPMPLRSLVIEDKRKGKKARQAEEKKRGVIREESPLVYRTDLPAQSTQMQQALLEAIQATDKPVPPPLYVVMGYKVRDEKPVQIESKEWSWSTGMSTLYLVKQGTMLRKDHGRFVIEGGRLAADGEPDEADGRTNSKSKIPNPKSKPEQILEIPIQEVGRILVLGRVQLSTSAIEVCLERQIPVIFMSQMGDYKGHLWSSEFCDLLTEAAQFGRRRDAQFQLEVARQIVWGKGMNSKLTLQRFNRRRKVDEVGTRLKRMDQLLHIVQQTTDLAQLRGYEGTIAKLYFAGLGQMITNSEFSLVGRNRRPPKDPVNSLLSFGYTLLFNNVMSLILAEGLNPYLGNLHRFGCVR